MTYRERLEHGLVALGFTLEPARTGKYTVWRYKGAREALFVGAAGALRRGECATRSHSIGDPVRQTNVYREVLAAGQQLDLVNAGVA